MSDLNKAAESLDKLYGPFRLVRGEEVLLVGGMTEGEITELTKEIAGTHIEHQNPETGMWHKW